MREITPTRGSLLARLATGNDDEAWATFHAIYAPAVFRFARECGLRPADAEEVRDQVFALLMRKLPTFRYDPDRGRFRSWLYRMTRGKVVDLLRIQRPQRLETAVGAQLTDGGDTPAAAWERACRAGELVAAMEQACSEASEVDAEAFRRLVSEDLPADDVAAAMGLTRNQVYKAKSKIMARVRELMG